jgi:hypothetical protein
MRFQAHVKEELPIRRQPPGAKLSICYFLGGEFSGERLHGTLLPGGGDWAIYRNEDCLDIEVRSVLQTHDGALIYMRYDGLWRAQAGTLPPVVAADGYKHYVPEQHYVRVFARFETDDARYAWLNGIVALGIGNRTEAGVSYDFHVVV